MTISVGARKYRIVTAMVSLLRYRAEFGESFLAAFMSPDFIERRPLCLSRLVWACIDEPKPDFLEFLDQAAGDESFADMAQAVQARVLMPSSQEIITVTEPDSASGTMDETDILALMAISGVSMSLVYEMPPFQLLAVVAKRSEIMGGQHAASATGTPKYRKMTNEETRSLYGR